MVKEVENEFHHDRFVMNTTVEFVDRVLNEVHDDEQRDPSLE